MRTVEQVLAELRELAQKAAAGEDVSQRRAACETELGRHGIHIDRSRKPQPSAMSPALRSALEQRGIDADNPLVGQVLGAAQVIRGGSRFVGPNADPAYVQERDSLTKAMGAGRVAAPGPQGGSGRRGSLADTMMSAKALAESTPSAGGVLVPPEVSNEIAELVRARVAVMQMGPTIVPVEKELSLPYMSTGSTAYYVAENARIPVSEPTFAVVPKLTPKELAALLPVSDRLLRDASTNPTLEDALRGDMAASLAGRQDLAFLQGLGESEEPLGIRNQPGINVIELGTNGREPTLADFRAVVGRVRSRNALFQRPGWIFHPDLLTFLESMTATDGRPLLETDLLTIDATGGGGKFLGYRFVTTTRIPTTLTHGTGTNATYVLFSGDWNECWVGENLDLTLEVSRDATYSPDGGTTHISAWQQRQTVFRALAAHDIALRRPEWFASLEGVLLG